MANKDIYDLACAHFSKLIRKRGDSSGVVPYILQLQTTTCWLAVLVPLHTFSHSALKFSSIPNIITFQ